MENQLQKLSGIEKHKAQIWLGIKWLIFFSLFLLQSCNSSDGDLKLEEREERPEELIADKSDGNEDKFAVKENVLRVNATAIKGRTQGTTFIIKTSEDSLLVSTKDIDSLLEQFDLALSGYIPNSTLSKFNRSEDYIILDEDVYFRTCYAMSMDVFERTQGLFDPSVFPLVKAWGFFKSMENPPRKKAIDSIMQFTGFKKGLYHDLLGDSLVKLHPSFELDFNAIAQGQSVDELARLLRTKGHENFFIEVGGEIVVEGLNDDDTPWVIGIDMPTEDNSGGQVRVLENYIHLSKGGLATSGNYRKYYVKDGRKYSHTLNPLTGYPVEHNLLSATVIAPNAAIADAYATVFMVMGVDKTMQFVQENKDLNLAVYLLYENENGRVARASNQLMQQYIHSN
jgi:thiamine biosynthesis lipoprotein